MLPDSKSRINRVSAKADTLFILGRAFPVAAVILCPRLSRSFRNYPGGQVIARPPSRCKCKWSTV